MLVNNQQGKVLPIILAFIIIAQLMGGFLLSQVVDKQKLVSYEEAYIYSNYITTAGLNSVINEVYNNPEIASFQSTLYHSLNELLYYENSIYTGMFTIDLIPQSDELVEIKVKSKVHVPNIEFDVNNVVVALVELNTGKIIKKEWFE
ncbi:hypothetical protein [Desulfuribacillus alkaliarsenatis]|uniref:Uncharacterized protein n=1 Tax=Desulfuribacillus alkaliarsenatis TaxID=766136 RepID=A0A1E5G5M6_9FIRM|nr:hypothetical protein [Desulfuribacillus alkaliarsenatis]OEF98409.1 hypothetical protein BHF68_01650 [Desulfuribacillus alkaliarsenatis]